MLHKCVTLDSKDGYVDISNTWQAQSSTAVMLHPANPQLFCHSFNLICNAETEPFARLWAAVFPHNALWGEGKPLSRKRCPGAGWEEHCQGEGFGPDLPAGVRAATPYPVRHTLPNPSGKICSPSVACFRSSSVFQVSSGKLPSFSTTLN